MRLLLDAIYILILAVLSPVWIARLLTSGKWRTDWAGRFGRVEDLPRGGAGGPRILLHAVSVGEVNALRTLVAALEEQEPKVRLTISATTNTGIERAWSLFGKRHQVCRFPLDFSFAVGRFLDAIQPDAVGLVELEVWPNFTAACHRRGIPICVINGRLSARSHKRYRLIRPLIRPSFRRLAFAAVQNSAYAKRFIDMGVPADRVHVTDTMKWDAALASAATNGADQLAESLGIDRTKLLVVAGSTAPGEHELLVASVPEGVQLLCAPRRPEWFDQAAQAMPDCARRSRGDRGSQTGRFLLDTLGELHAAYALADVVVIGRSFGSLYGSDMCEPVALGKPTVVGPAVSDFQDTVDALLEGGGLIQTTADELPAVLGQLCEDDAARAALAERGLAVIRQREGASMRHAQMLLNLVSKKSVVPAETGTTKEEKEERAGEVSPRGIK